MSLRLTQLNKLRGRGVRELRVRGTQELACLLERLWGVGVGEMSDAELLAGIAPAVRNGSVNSTAAELLARLRTTPAQAVFPAPAQRAQLAALMNERFPAARAALIARADGVLAGRFDLLGCTGLSFGNPIDWRLEPLTGRRTPLAHWSEIDFLNPTVAGDKKITWELNRHQFFVTLGQAYWLTGDECYAESFGALAESWMDANPPKRGINWASSLETALRTISWLWALHLFAPSPHLHERFVARLLKFLLAHGRHIETYLSHYFSPNTHLTGEALGLFYLGTALPELRRAEHWRRLGLRILLEQLPLHVRRDGVYFEQSSYYHRYTTDFYLHLSLLARATNTPLPPPVAEKLPLLLDHLMWITRPDGSATLYGDDDGGRLLTLGNRAADDFRDTLTTGAALFGRSDWRFVAGAAGAELPWLLGPEGVAAYDRIAPVKPEARTRAFTDGGYWVMRDDWTRDGAYLFIDCGPHGALNCGHAHADALSFEFTAGGTNWLVDPGTYTYTGEARARDEFRSAHNTVTIDDEPQSMPAGPFSWRHIARNTALELRADAEGTRFTGCTHGYERLADPVTHTRSFEFKKATPAVPAHLLVRDQFAARAHHRYALHFHFAPDCRVSASANAVRAVAADGSRLLLATLAADEPPQARVEAGWVSRCYAQRTKAATALMEADARGTAQLITVLMPVAAGDNFDFAQFIAGLVGHETDEGVHL